MSSYYVEFSHEIKGGYVYLYINNYGMEYEDDPDPWDGPYYSSSNVAYTRITYRIPESDHALFKEKVFKFIGQPTREITEEELDQILGEALCAPSPWHYLKLMCEPYGIPLEYIGSEDVSGEQKKAMDEEKNK